MSKNYWKQLGWLIVIWVSSVAGLAIVAYGFRILMTSAGLKTS